MTQEHLNVILKVMKVLGLEVDVDFLLNRKDPDAMQLVVTFNPNFVPHSKMLITKRELEANGFTVEKYRSDNVFILSLDSSRPQPMDVEQWPEEPTDLAQHTEDYSQTKPRPSEHEINKAPDWWTELLK